MRTILIAGTSTGIGNATALNFQAAGWNVVATMREPRKATDFIALHKVSVLPLDVTKFDAISTSIPTAIDKFGTTDILLNNAGYGLIGPLEAVQPEH